MQASEVGWWYNVVRGESGGLAINYLGEEMREGQSHDHRHPSFLAPIPKIPTGSTNRLDKVGMVTKDVLASLIISGAGWVS